MIFQSTDFKEAFFRWALEEAEHEVIQGFPLLRNVESEEARAIVEFVGALDEIDKRLFVQHGVAKAFDQPTSPSGQALFEQVLQAILKRYSGKPIGRINRSGIRKSVISSIERHFKTEADRFSPSEIVFRISVRSAEIETLVDFGGKSQLRYSQNVKSKDGTYVVQFVDLQAWMGLGHTKWDSVEDANKCADTFVKCCERFFSAVTRCTETISV